MPTQTQQAPAQPVGQGRAARPPYVTAKDGTKPAEQDWGNGADTPRAVPGRPVWLRQRLGRRSGVPASPAVNSIRNFRSGSGTGKSLARRHAARAISPRIVRAAQTNKSAPSMVVAAAESRE